MDNGVQRRDWIKARIEAIRQELDELLRELGAPETGIDEAEQRRRKFTLYKGGLLLLLLLLSAGYLVARYRRALIATGVTAAAMSVAAVAILGHGAPSRTVPPGALGSPQLSTVGTGSSMNVRPTHARGGPSPRRTLLVPVIVPPRPRRSPSPSTPPDVVPSGGPIPEPPPDPTVSVGASSPSASATPVPSQTCSDGIWVWIGSIGVKVCV